MSAGSGWSSWAEELAARWAELREVLGGAEGFAPGAVGTLVRLGRPVDPFDRPGFLAAAVGIAGLLLGVVLAGVAVASLGALLGSLLGLGLILTRVFGISIEVAR